MFKKRTLFLVALLGLLLLFLPGALATEQPAISVFSVEPQAGVSYDGYLVSVRPGVEPRIAPLSVGMVAIGDDLYRADSIEDIRQIFREDQIVVIEPNYEIVLFATPNDPLFGQQWCMTFINAPLLWERGITGAGVRIGIIDSGITPHHEDLDPSRVAPGFNFLARNTNVQDNIGHGTEVAGIIVATRNNGVGMAGLLDQVTIVPLKVFDSGNSNLSYAIQAINDAVHVFEVDVINMSWGILGGAQSRILEDAVNNAVDHGIIVVAAAGNDGDSTLSYPAAFSNVVAVGAVDRNGTVAYFSQRNETITVTAPGVDLRTLGHQHASHYVTVSGTSFSAPYVAAMAAVAKAIDPSINAEQFMELLIQSVIDRGPAGFDIMYGYGTIDIGRFLAVLPGMVWFDDITGHWAHGSILQVAELGLFGGIGDHAFGPDQTMNRAMFVTVLGRLYRQSGGYVSTRNDDFSDTQNNSWYSPYVAWAAERGIVAGFPGNEFGPYAAVSREQAATFLARFARYTGRNVDGDVGSLYTFVDRNAVSGWAEESQAWAVEQGIITGVSVSGGTALQPTDDSSRAQVAVIMLRFLDRMGIQLYAAA
ncbi:MAG: S8 family serine peptidase [Oscillospiraceae bacterium]|nr:S8 family serine peptidase [Oscillospiraceae bacterium]